jgi:hypothetical protein
MAEKKPPSPAAPTPAAPTRRAAPARKRASNRPPPLTADQIKNREIARAMAEKEAREEADFKAAQELYIKRVAENGGTLNPNRDALNRMYAEVENRNAELFNYDADQQEYWLNLLKENIVDGVPFDGVPVPEEDPYAGVDILGGFLPDIESVNKFVDKLGTYLTEASTNAQAAELNALLPALAATGPGGAALPDGGSSLIGGWPSINQNAFSSKRGKMGFSGCDINAMIRVPARTNFYGNDFNDERIFQIGTLQTISISTYNAKTPVKALGFKNPISIARGGRTIAGTMIFNQLNTHVLNEFEFGSQTNSGDGSGLLSYSSGRDSKGMEVEATKFGATQVAFARKEWDFSWDTKRDFGIPQKPSDVLPFDIVLTMINEAGAIGKIMLYDVDIIHDSQTLSVEDIYTEVQYQYVARDIDYFNPVDLNQAWNWEAKETGHTVVRPEDLYNRMLIKSYLAPREAKTPSYSMGGTEKLRG